MGEQSVKIAKRPNRTGGKNPAKSSGQVNVMKKLFKIGKRSGAGFLAAQKKNIRAQKIAALKVGKPLNTGRADSIAAHSIGGPFQGYTASREGRGKLLGGIMRGIGVVDHHQHLLPPSCHNASL
jgi:hypothetical protein